MKSNVFFIAVMFLLYGNTSAQNMVQNILFLGCKESGSPAISATYEKDMRDRLGTIPGSTLISYVATGRIRDILEFERYPSIIPENLDKIRGTVPDSTIIIWSSIKGLEIESDCSWLSRCVTRGTLTVRHSIFMLVDRHILFDGVITSKSSLKQKGFNVLPRPQTEHIPVTDRKRLTDQLLYDDYSRSISIISSLLQTNLPPQTVETSVEKNTPAGPSISDLFSVPSVEAAKIDYSAPNEPLSSTEKSKRSADKKNQKTNKK